MEKPVPKLYLPLPEELDSFNETLNSLIAPDSMHPKFIKRMNKRIRMISGSKKQVLLDTNDIAQRAFSIHKGSALVFGNRESEVRLAKARLGIMNDNTPEDIEESKIAPLIKELKRDLKKIKISEFLIPKDFIYPVNLLNGKPSPIKIVLSEDSVLFSIEKEDYEELMLYRDLLPLTDGWLDKRFKRILQYESEQDGKVVVDNMVWLDEKWPGVLDILPDLLIGQYLGYSREVINGNIKKAKEIIRNRNNGTDIY